MCPLLYRKFEVTDRRYCDSPLEMMLRCEEDHPARWPISVGEHPGGPAKQLDPFLTKNNARETANPKHRHQCNAAQNYRKGAHLGVN